MVGRDGEDPVVSLVEGSVSSSALGLDCEVAWLRRVPPPKEFHH